MTGEGGGGPGELVGAEVLAGSEEVWTGADAPLLGAVVASEGRLSAIFGW